MEIHELPAQATFEAEVNIPNLVGTWLKNGRVISPKSDKYKVVAQGTSHKLILNKLDETDDADYTVVVKQAKSTALLTIKGKQIFLKLVNVSI